MTEQRERAQELRQEVLDRVEQLAQRDFADTRYNWLRTQGRRRLLVVGCYAMLLLYGVGLFGDYHFLPLIGLIGFGLSLWLMRMAVRSVVDLPDEVVDERMREVRGITYREAYLGVMTLISLHLVAYIANRVLAKAGVFDAFTAEDLHQLTFLLFFAAMALPGALYAWRERHV